MSETENLPAAAEAVELPVETAVSDAAAAVDQLRALVCGLVIGLLLSSAAFTLFVFKQTRTLKYQGAARAQQLQQAREFEKAALPTVQELARYSVGKPELLAIFSRYGMQLSQNVGPAGAPASP